MHDVTTTRLDNGLTLHVATSSLGHHAPVAAVQAWVGVGSVDEGPHEAGAAHVVEHMLFKGSQKYGVGELVHTLERGGGEINAWTAFDHTVYHAVLGRDHVDAAIDALGDTLLSPRVDPEELARERRVVLEEIRHGSDDPARGVAQSLFATAFAVHPYRRPVIGTPDSVRALAPHTLLEFFRNHYVADNVTLVVAGDVDGERVRRTVERRFRKMPSGRLPRRIPVEPEQTAPRASAAHRDVAEAYLAVGFHVPAARHPDLASLDVAAILLGQSESARLPRLLRDRDGLATTATATVHALRDPGLFVLSATAGRAEAQRTVGALVDHAVGLVEDIDSEELDKARIAAESGFVRQLETAQGRARSLGWYATMTGDPHFGHVYLDRIRAVRRHDLAHVTRRYLRADNASVAAILPTRATASFAKRAETAVKKSLGVPPAVASPVEKRVVLANGLALLVRRDPSVPIVAMRAVWRGGQRAEDAKSAGASTLLARMITRGCGALDAAGVADRIDRLGGALSGVAGRNSFGVAGEWLARTWQQGFELLADCVLDPAVPASELAREKKLLVEDQAAQADNPTQVAFRVFSETLYRDHPYARDILGTPDSIGDVDRTGLLAFYRDRYPASAATIAIVGDVDVDDAIALVKKRFGVVAAARPGAAATPKPPVVDGRSPAEREVYRYQALAQAHVVMGFPGATVNAPDRFALEILVAILGGQGGRLFAELREKRGLVYRVSAHSVEGLDPGFVAIYFSCAPDKVDEAVAQVRAELDRVRTGGVTTEEIDRARSFLAGAHQIAMQRRAAVANAMAYHEAYGLGWDTWSRYDDALRAVGTADIAAAATTYLRPDRMVDATVRPPSTSPGAAKRSKLPGPPPPPPRPAPPRPVRTRPRGNV